MNETITKLIDVLISLGVWSLAFILYIILGALFGSWLSNRGEHDSDDLRWIIFGIVIFCFGLFPITFYLVSIP